MRKKYLLQKKKMIGKKHVQTTSIIKLKKRTMHVLFGIQAFSTSNVINKSSRNINSLRQNKSKL